MRRNLFGKRHYSHSEKIIQTGILVVIVNLIILLAVFFVAGNEIADVVFGDFVYAVNKGVISDDIQYVGESSDNKEYIDENSWISPKAGQQYGRVVCEEIGLDVPLYLGDNDAILMKGAGQSAESYFPGQQGLTLVGGHDTTFFSPLSKLDDNFEGKNVKIDTTYGVFEYEVKSREIIRGSEFEITQGKEQLVLYTCYPFGEISQERTEKILFYCEKISGPVIGGGSRE